LAKVTTSLVSNPDKAFEWFFVINFMPSLTISFDFQVESIFSLSAKSRKRYCGEMSFKSTLTPTDAIPPVLRTTMS
jgi:hypothetical protein